MADHEESWYWQDYWRQGNLACCLTSDLRSGYDGPLAESWADFFASLPEGGRLLDIGTGNGGLALLAVETGRDFDITAIDLALIEPLAYVDEGKEVLRNVHFEGGIDARDLPHEDCRFDAVISQFGLEFAGFGEALAEAARVTKSDGLLRAVVHASQGAAEQEARRELERVDRIDGVMLHDRLREAVLAVDALTAGRGAKPNADAAVAAFADALEVLENGQTATALNMRLMAIFESVRSMPLGEVLKAVDVSERAFEAHSLRLRALMAAACDEGQISEACAVLARHRVTAGFFALMDGPNILAWVIEGRKH